MAWIPSRDQHFAIEQSTPFWDMVEPIFAVACPIANLPRGDWTALKSARSIALDVALEHG
jgi:hypothetical protein